MLRALFGEGRATPTLLLWLAFLPTLLILYLFLNWLPTLVIAKGLDRAVAPQASLAFNFGSVAGALVFGWLVDRFHFRWPLTLAYLLLIVTLLLLSASNGHAMVIGLERRGRLLPARRQLCVVWCRACLLSTGDSRHRLRRQHRRRARGVDRRAVAGGPVDRQWNQRGGRGAVHGAGRSGLPSIAVFALSFRSRAEA